MKLKNALENISPDDEQREKMFRAVREKLAESDGKDANIMKKTKIAAVAAAVVGAFLAVSGTAYAVSPEAREVIDDILGINRKSVDEYYSIYGNDSADVDLLDTALQITEEDGSKPFADGIRAKLTSVLNYGSGVELTVEFTFDNIAVGQVYDFGNVSLEGGGSLSGWAGSLMDIQEGGEGKAFMRININSPETGLAGQKLTVTLKDLVPIGENGREEDKTISGEYSAEFTVGEAVKANSEEFEPVHISWTDDEMFGAVAEMEVSRMSWSPKNVSFGIRMTEDCVVDGDNGIAAAEYTNSIAMFCCTTGFADMWTKDVTEPSEHIPLKFKMSDGSITNAVYTTASVQAAAYVNKQENVVMDFTTDKVNDVYFEFPGIMDYSNVEAIIFCGHEFNINGNETEKTAAE